MTDLSRRALLRQLATTAAATVAANLFPQVAFAGWKSAAATVPGDVSWKKAPCRFCGVGCGLLVGVAKGKAVAVKGDPDSPVNRGLACVKGYHSVMALYGQDRLKNAWVRENGKLKRIDCHG